MALSKIEESGAKDNSDDVKREKKARKRKKGVYRKIVSQTEFYLSDANLRHSKYLLPIYQSDPWIELKLFLNFNKVATMLTEIVDADSSEEDKIVELGKALSYIESENIVLSDCKTKVSRKIPFVPASSTDIDSCTVYAENLPPDADHDSIRSLFLPFGEVVYVSMPKFKSGRSKGFAFIEFKKTDSVEKVLEDFTNVDHHDKTENLASVRTFNEEREESEVKQQSAIGNKRKLDENGSKNVVKRVKIQEDVQEVKNKDAKVDVRQTNSGSDIQVLSKSVWKKLRNKYLDEQRKNFGAMKQNFRKAKTPRYVERQYVEKAEPEGNTVEIKPGVIVKIELEAEVDNAQDFKRLVRTAVDGEKVGYVDVRIGHTTAFVRCEDAAQAKKLEESTFSGAVGKEILKGQEEKDYHKKVVKDKNEKRSGKVKVVKTKTKAKVIEKVENLKNSHVYFE